MTLHLVLSLHSQHGGACRAPGVLPYLHCCTTCRVACLQPLAPQGINRLGAGPRKPGIARPVDPNRFIVQDLVPEGVENDQDYKRMVQDVRPLLREVCALLLCASAAL